MIDIYHTRVYYKCVSTCGKITACIKTENLDGFDFTQTVKRRRKMAENRAHVCSDRVKHRTEKEYKDLMNRLSRIEGQVRGVAKMVEDDRYCIDILNQVGAINSALNAFSRELLTEHIRTCVVNDIKEGDGSKVDELCDTIKRLMK